MPDGFGAGPGCSVAPGEGPETAAHTRSLMLRFYLSQIMLLGLRTCGPNISSPCTFCDGNNILVHLYLSEVR